MPSLIVRVAATCTLMLPVVTQAQARGFVVMLGSDTIGVERFERSGDRVVNTQTGQWETAYDGSKDLVRIPLDPHVSLPASEERFRIFVQNDMLMMHWDRGGYGVTIKSK